MVFLGCDLRRRQSTATISGASGFHFAVRPLYKACFASPEPGPFRARPFAASAQNTGLPSPRPLRPPAHKRHRTSLAIFRLFERGTDVELVRGQEGFGRFRRERRGRFLFGGFLQRNPFLKPVHLTPDGPRIVNVAFDRLDRGFLAGGDKRL
jgi:hypothetical protein